jgi:[acyl-carrier-protein] S-malonyltransferase
MQRLALLFPGQGAQVVGMGKSLAAEYAPAREIFERADQVLGQELGRVCFEGPPEELTRTAWCQPALYTHSLAALAVLQNQFPDLQFQFCAGLSLGEFTALAAAGVFGFDEGLRTVHRRGVFMQEACDASEGAMAAVLGAEVEQIRSVCKEAEVQIANLNGPGQIVISGEKSKVVKAITLARERGAKKTSLLQVAGAYHSRLMEPAASKLADWLAPLELRPTPITVLANVTAGPHEFSDIKKRLVEQVTGTVLWEDSVRHLGQAGMTHFLEVGTGEVLTNLVKRILPSAKRAFFGKPEDLDAVQSFLSSPREQDSLTLSP